MTYLLIYLGLASLAATCWILAWSVGNIRRQMQKGEPPWWIVPTIERGKYKLEKRNEGTILNRTYEPVEENIIKCEECGEICNPFPTRHSRLCSACWYAPMEAKI